MIMKKLLVLGIVALLSGCVSTIAYRVQPEVEVQVMYPQNEAAYLWDPAAISFFFVVGRQRHYMHRDWHPRHGYPHGHYKHHGHHGHH